MSQTRIAGLPLVLAALAAAALGQAMQLVALNVLVLSRTHSAPAVAALWVVPQLALMATGPFVGSLTDRWDKRTTLLVSNVAAGLVVLTLPFVPAVWMMYAAVGTVAALDGLFRSTFDPYFRLLVPAEGRTRANAVRGVMQYGALVAGPAMAGALLIHGRPDLVLEVNAALLMVSGFLLAWIPGKNPDESADGAGAPGRWRQDVVLVWQFFREHRAVGAVLGLFNLGFVFGVAADAEEVVFVHRALLMTASTYGVLVSMAGVGYVLGAVASWLVATRVSARRLVQVGPLVSGAAYLTYALAHGFAQAAGGLIALGVFQALANTGFAAFMQGALPPERMGRIASVLRSLVAGFTIMAALAGGLMVSHFGVRSLMVTATGLMVMQGLALALVCRSPGAAVVFDRAATA